MPFVFDRFRQADASSTRVYGGLGLDLSIVRYLVELHVDTVSAHSNGEEQGALFIVRLPLSAIKGALLILRDWHPDVLISDISMPDEGGYSLIQQLRALPDDYGGKMPAIALTAYARSEDRVRAIAYGFQNHVSKPVDVFMLKATVASLASYYGVSRQPTAIS